MSNPGTHATSVEHLDALRAEGRISNADYNVLRDALDKTPARNTSASREKQNRLCKSWEHRELGGVCAGIAERMAISPSTIRILFILAAIVSAGAAAIVYVGFYYLLPWDDTKPVHKPVLKFPAKLVAGWLVLNAALLGAYIITVGIFAGANLALSALSKGIVLAHYWLQSFPLGMVIQLSCFAIVWGLYRWASPSGTLHKLLPRAAKYSFYVGLCLIVLSVVIPLMKFSSALN